MLGVSASPQTPTSVPMVPHDIRALLIDDSQFDRARIRRMSDNMQLPILLDEVDSIDEMDSALGKADYDLVLIDYRLPVGDGMVALDHLLRNSRNRDAGKIMITGNEAVETAVQAMRAGCHDFLSKDRMNPEVLRQAMLNAMSTAMGRMASPQIPMDQDQRELIRQGIISAFADSQMQENLAAILSGSMRTDSSHSVAQPFDPATLHALIKGTDDPDDFVFH